ncbi:unnamed protein product [Prunus armeniaca]
MSAAGPTDFQSLSPSQPRSTVLVARNRHETGRFGQFLMEFHGARSDASGHQIGRVRYGFLAIFHVLAASWAPLAARVCGGAWAAGWVPQSAYNNLLVPMSTAFWSFTTHNHQVSVLNKIRPGFQSGIWVESFHSLCILACKIFLKVWQGKKVDDAGSSDFEKEALLMKDAKALGIIQGGLSKGLSQKTFSLGFRMKKPQRGLRCDFEYTRMRDDETLSGYLTHLLELVNQMKGYGEDLSKGRLVQKLLISLTKEFDPVCYVIEQTKDIETIEVQEVIAALRGFAQRLDRHAESTTEKAFSSMSINQKGSQPNSGFGNNKSKKSWKLKG